VLIATGAGSSRPYEPFILGVFEVFFPKELRQCLEEEIDKEERQIVNYDSLRDYCWWKDSQMMRNCPKPIGSKVRANPANVERRVMCASYEHCLDEAVRRKWSGFSCRECGAFKPLQLNETEWLFDSLACSALMGVAEHYSRFKQKRRGRIVLKLRRLHSLDTVLDFC